VTEPRSGRPIASTVEEAVDILVREMKPRRIVLFGSMARGDAGPESDVDLLLIMDKFTSRFAEMRRAREVLAPLKVPFDVLVYSVDEVAEWGDVVNHILNDALLDGRVLYDAA
jgi:predicted nucleotidyltransferase